MKTFLSFYLLVFCLHVYSQTDTQKRFQSETRKFYVWNKEVEKYELKDTEYENSVIDIREIGSKSNGYITISMVDNGLSKLQHGSIYDYKQTSDNEGSWFINSKYMKGKVTYNPKENTITFLYGAEEKRYTKLMIFYVKEDKAPNAGLKTIEKFD